MERCQWSTFQCAAWGSSDLLTIFADTSSSESLACRGWRILAVLLRSSSFVALVDQVEELSAGQKRRIVKAQGIILTLLCLRCTRSLSGRRFGSSFLGKTPLLESPGLGVGQRNGWVERIGTDQLIQRRIGFSCILFVESCLVIG